MISGVPQRSVLGRDLFMIYFKNGYYGLNFHNLIFGRHENWERGTFRQGQQMSSRKYRVVFHIGVFQS